MGRCGWCHGEFDDLKEEDYIAPDGLPLGIIKVCPGCRRV